MPRPQGPHEIVEALARETLPQFEVERHADDRAIGVIGHEDIGIDRIDRARGIDERRAQAHLLRRRVDPRRDPRRIVDDAAQHRSHLAQIFVDAGQPRAPDRQRPVIAGEPLGQPQRRRGIGTGEVERLEFGRADALDVPAMEEFMRQRAELVVLRSGQRSLVGDDRRVAMLHPVAGDRRAVIGDEGIAAEIIGRGRAEDADLLAHHPLRLLGIAVHVGGAAVMMQRKAIGLAALLPFADHMVRQLGRAVHEILQVRRPIGVRRIAFGQLRRDLPFRVGALEADADRLRIVTARPQEGRRHVQVRMAGVDLRIGAVAMIGEQRVGDDDRAVMPRDAPAIGIAARQLQRPSGAVGGGDVIDVLGEFVDRIASRRRPRHLHAQGASGHPGPGRGNPRAVMRDLRERHVVAHLRRHARIALAGGGGRMHRRGLRQGGERDRGSEQGGEQRTDHGGSLGERSEPSRPGGGSFGSALPRAPRCSVPCRHSRDKRCRTFAAALPAPGEGTAQTAAFLQPSRCATIRPLFPGAKSPTSRRARPGIALPDRTTDQPQPLCETRTSVNFMNFGRQKGAGPKSDPAQTAAITACYPAARASAFLSFSCADFLIWQIRAAPTPSTCPISSRFSSST